MTMRPPHPDLISATTKEENIYIPSFISKRPFYAGGADDDVSSAPGATPPTDYLQHQRLQKRDAADAQWYDRGRKAGPAATRFRKGACDNCGAMAHKARDCLDRPRAKGARWSGADIRPDQVIQDVSLGWDAKRDRWNGYDPREYKAVIGEYQRLDEVRKRALGNDSENDRYAEENDMSKHQSTATRQLRIREDTAKYLLNLDVDSAKYDPKTRALVDAGATAADPAAQLFAEEGFLRSAGDAAAMDMAQRHAWEAQERDGDTTHHLQANPTAGEVLRRRDREEDDRRRQEREKLLQDAYGGENTSTKPPIAASSSMAVTESEAFVEYDEHGLVKGAPRLILRSKYAEDVFGNNHTAVWGSWWHDFVWGYACCRSTLRGSYCTGEAGCRAWEAENERRLGNINHDDKEDVKDYNKVDEKEDDKKEENKSSSKKRARADNDAAAKKQKQTHNGLSEEDLDNYRRQRVDPDDPLAKMMKEGDV